MALFLDKNNFMYNLYRLICPHLKLFLYVVLSVYVMITNVCILCIYLFSSYYAISRLRTTMNVCGPLTGTQC